MANKQNFTPEEWTKVLESTMLAGIAVSQADPSGLWGTLKEYFANTSALDPSKLAPDSSELIKQSSMPTHLQTQLPSKLGYAASVRKWQRLLWRAVSSDLEALE